MESYLIKNNQSLEDVCCATYGTMEYLTKLVFDNENIGSIDVDMNEISGQLIYFDETLVNKIPVEVKVLKPIEESAIKYYTGIEGQSIYDVCIQLYGSLEKLILLCNDNNLRLTRADNVKNIEFKYNTNKIEDVLLVNFFKTLGTGVGSYSINLAKGKSYDSKAFDDSFN